MNLLLLSLLTAASSWIDLLLVTAASCAVARLPCGVNGGAAAAACWRVATTATSPEIHGVGGGVSADDATGGDCGRKAASSSDVASLPWGCLFPKGDCLKTGPATSACWLLAAATSPEGNSARDGAAACAAAVSSDNGCRSEAATCSVAIITCEDVAALGGGWKSGDAAAGRGDKQGG